MLIFAWNKLELFRNGAIMIDLISQSKFVKLVKGHQSTISKWMKCGDLPSKDGMLIMPDAEKIYHLKKAGLPVPKRTEKEEVPKSLTAEDVEVIKDDGKKLLKAKAEKETHLAELNKLKLLKEQGKLIEIDEVINQCNKAMEIVRSELLNLASRVAMVLEGKSAHEIQLKLEDEVNHAMQSLFDLGGKYQEEGAQPESVL